MTTPKQQPVLCRLACALTPASLASTSVDAICQSVADGRRRARSLASWARRFDLSEPEFQVLWYLRGMVAVVSTEAESDEPEAGWSDQATIARDLTVSPAKVSAIVERLRIQGWIIRTEVPNDRRRNLWRLTFSGRGLLGRMLSDVDQLLAHATPSDRSSTGELPIGKREVA